MSSSDEIRLARLFDIAGHGKWPRGEAGRLLSLFGDAPNLYSSGGYALRDAGLTEAQAALLMTVSAAAGRCALQRLGPNPRLDDAETAAAFVRAIYVGVRGERFSLILTDDRLSLLEWKVLSEGTAGEIVLQSARVLEAVALSDARCVIFCHNHPGGTPRFSRPDVATTENLCRALSRIGVCVYDHLLLAGSRVVSMKEENLLPGVFSRPSAE